MYFNYNKMKLVHCVCILALIMLANVICLCLIFNKQWSEFHEFYERQMECIVSWSKTETIERKKEEVWKYQLFYWWLVWLPVTVGISGGWHVQDFHQATLCKGLSFVSYLSLLVLKDLRIWEFRNKFDFLTISDFESEKVWWI